jgi:16S rRNA (adenine1518-N6/adenine1519-N6)-dimethyltransferase
VLEEDAKETDIARWLASGPGPRVLAGNLPYQITGPLLSRTVGAVSSVDRAVFLVQLEVADRLCASPGTPEYGALTVFVRAAFSTRRELVVRRGAFYPQPNVDSAVVVLEPREPVIEETALFRSLVRAAFAQRRKILKNAWRAIAPDSGLEGAAQRAGIDLGLRGEVLAVDAFARMAQELGR